MKDKVLRFVLVVSLLLNLSVLVSAGYTHYTQSRQATNPFGSGHPKGDHFFEELSLTPDQLKTVRQKASAFHEALDGKRGDVATLRSSLITLMRAGQPDTAGIDATVSRINRLQEDIQKMAATHILDLKAQMNNEQQKRFLDLIEGATKESKDLHCPG
jgi:Spy/CpxP family protein refolding chaperone